MLNSEDAEQNHWSERGRVMSVANAGTLSRPRRSVLSFDNKMNSALTIRMFSAVLANAEDEPFVMDTIKKPEASVDGGELAELAFSHRSRIPHKFTKGCCHQRT